MPLRRPNIRNAPTAHETEPELTVAGRFMAILKGGAFPNLIVAVGITVGFFHGYLKIRFPSPITTFAFDLVMGFALVVVLLQNKKGDIFPRGVIGSALVVFYAVCVLSLAIPIGPPLLIKAAAIRGWCYATFMFGLGYHLTHSLNQVKGYFYVVILLGVITAVIGIRQNPKELEAQMAQDDQMAARYGQSYFGTKGGREFRRYSTFISAGAFGGTMAFVMVFAIALLSDPLVKKAERVALALTVVPIAYGLILSGARTALMNVGFGFAVIGWYRRSLQNFIVIPAIVVLAFKLGSSVSSGALDDRYGSLLQFEPIFYRNWIPTKLGLEYMAVHPLGGGLGTSGYSIPFFLLNRVSAEYDDWYGADGDLGRLMIELGVPGLIFFGRVLWLALAASYRWLVELRGTPVGSVALASAACVVVALADFPSGSPFLSIPCGALTWFFLGTLNKLADGYRGGTLAGVTQGGDDAGAAPPAPSSTKRFLHYRPPAQKMAPKRPANPP